MTLPQGWAQDVLAFWFKDSTPEQHFKKDEAFDTLVRDRFHALHAAVAAAAQDVLLADAGTALAAVIVLDQFSRNMFRGTPQAFASDGKALALAEAAIARGFDVATAANERLFVYMPFEHADHGEAQARCVALMATLGDPALGKWAQAHKAIIDRFGRFPHRNAILGRPSTSEERAFLEQPGSSF